MKGKFTEDDILKVVYGELIPDEFTMQKELEQNPDLKAFYDDVMHVKHQLDRIKEHPDHSSVNIILEHSGSFSSLETSH